MMRTATDGTGLERNLHVEHVKAVCARVGLSRTSIFEMVRAGEFPRPIALTPSGKRKGWLTTEVDAWLDQRISERDERAAV